MPAVIWSGTSSIEASARFGGLFYCPAVGSTRKGERGAVVAVAAAETVSEAA
jgi:hypothetical protein